MRLRIFQSDKGDCLLLTSKQGRHILVDGGMRAAYSRHVAPSLAEMRRSGESLDLVYVSHIDQDHISGVLQLLDDLAAWRIYDYQVESGYPRPRRPLAERPPEVQSIWHNSFHDQIGKNAGNVSDLLAASSEILSAASSPALQLLSEHQQELALSEAEALRVSQRIHPSQLNIPLNEPYGGKLMHVAEGRSRFQVGDLEVFVIGPFEKDLAKLRDEWNDWLAENEARVRVLRRDAQEDARRMGNSLADMFSRLSLEADAFGSRSRVSPPNLASLMLYIEEPRPRSDPIKYLLTGDGHWEDILKGLDFHGKLQDGKIHVDVLKVQHHGSEHNMNADFCRDVTADHYIFCGNGKHHNPDLGIIDLLLDARLSGNGRSRCADRTKSRFKLWFSSDEQTAGNESAARHMGNVQELVKRRVRRARGRVEFAFSGTDYLDLIA